MKKNLIIFASQNSFFTLPPVKQILNYFKKITEISAIHSEIGGYENFFSESRNTSVVQNYNDYDSYYRQTILNKFFKYFKVTTSLFSQVFKNIFSYETIYIYSCELYVIYIAIMLKSKKIKIIYHQFEMMIPNELNKIDRWLLQEIIRKFKKVDLAIFPEQNRMIYFREMLLTHNSNQLFILPNTNNNVLIDDYSRQNQKIRVTHIGSVGSNHHFQDYLKALKKLPKDRFEFWFVGMLNSDIQDMILEEDLENIITTGQIQHSALTEIYLNTDIGVILYKDTCLHNRFCAPNKLYEFWSYGIPVLGDILPGLKSVFKYKEQGILIDMQQPDEIVDAITKLEAFDKDFRDENIKIFNSTYRLDVYLGKINNILNIT